MAICVELGIELSGADEMRAGMKEETSRVEVQCGSSSPVVFEVFAGKRIVCWQNQEDAGTKV